jgi:hypothetical protein
VGTSIFDLSPDRTADAVDVADLHLVESLREGSERAYEELLIRFQQPVYALALRLLDDQSEACDVVQEVFLKVFRNVGSFRGQSTLKTWIPDYGKRSPQLAPLVFPAPTRGSGTGQESRRVSQLEGDYSRSQPLTF